MNVRQLIKKRETLLDTVRHYFKGAGFIEAETPHIVPSPGIEPHLDAFKVLDSTGKHAGYLPTSPEYAMKKLLARGSGSIFQICKSFRDEPPGGHHLREFTMLEWYRTGADYQDAMLDCEQLCAAAAKALAGSHEIVWHDKKIDFTPPFERITVRQAFKEYAGLDLQFDEPVEIFRTIARGAGCIDIVEDDSWDDVFFKIFLRHVEPNIGLKRPAIIYDYPIHMAALSRTKRFDPLACERFELYAGGLELANAFSELTDPAEQRKRFEKDNETRRLLGRNEMPIDEHLLEALASMPDCAGVALGLDRLFMLLTDTKDIRKSIAL